VSVTVEKREVPRGEDAYIEAAWQLKEQISAAEGVLRQRRRFFTNAYRRAKVYLLCSGQDVVGFAAARRDGYILFLAVAPSHRGEGHGRRLVAEVADESDTVTCHARESNEGALEFYRTLEFEVVRTIENYYEDGGTAYYLRLGDSERLLEKLSGLFRR